MWIIYCKGSQFAVYSGIVVSSAFQVLWLLCFLDISFFYHLFVFAVGSRYFKTYRWSIWTLFDFNRSCQSNRISDNVACWTWSCSYIFKYTFDTQQMSFYRLKAWICITAFNVQSQDIQSRGGEGVVFASLLHCIFFLN